MGMIKIPERSIDFFQANFDEILSTGHFAEGKWNNEIKNYVVNLTGTNSALPTNSNGAGMVALLTIYRHYFNRKNVIIQSNTMYGVKTMVAAGGCKLIDFIPCRLETLMPSIDDVKITFSKIDKKDKENLIILLSHIGGIINPDIEEIAYFCKNEDIILLEDCAHSFGATLNKKHSGLFGDAGVYSFYATKAIPAGEGGVIVTNDEEIGELVTKYSIYDRFDQSLEIGNNIRISEIQALFTFSILKEWSQIIENKFSMAENYIQTCEQYNIKYISQSENGQQGNYYKFIIYTPNEFTLDKFPGLKTTTSQVYDYEIGSPNCVANQHACLPIWYNQDPQIVDKVIKELTKN